MEVAYILQKNLTNPAKIEFGGWIWKILDFFKISRFFPRYILAEIQFLRGRANRADIKNFRAIRAEAKNASGRVGSGWPFFGPYGPRAGRADGLWPDPPLLPTAVHEWATPAHTTSDSPA